MDHRMGYRHTAQSLTPSPAYPHTYQAGTPVNPRAPSAGRPQVAPSPAPQVQSHQTPSRNSTASHHHSNEVAPANPSCSLTKLHQLTHNMMERCQSIPPQSNIHLMSQNNSAVSSTLTPPPNTMRSAGNSQKSNATVANPFSAHYEQLQYYNQMGHSHMNSVPNNHPPRSASAAPSASAVSANEHKASSSHFGVSDPHSQASASVSTKSKSKSSSQNLQHASNSAAGPTASSSGSNGTVMAPNNGNIGPNLMHYSHQYSHQFAAQYFSGAAAAGFLNQHHHSHAAAMQQMMQHGQAGGAGTGHHGHTSQGHGQNEYQDPRTGQSSSLYSYGPYPGHPGLLPQLNPSMRR
jgi:hypothetical protein